MSWIEIYIGILLKESTHNHYIIHLSRQFKLNHTLKVKEDTFPCMINAVLLSSIDLLA